MTDGSETVIAGRELTFPVEVRAATSWTASFLVEQDVAQAVVDPTGLEVATPLPGKALMSIPVVKYRDSDLDAYNEVGIAFLVRPHRSRPTRAALKVLEVARGHVGIYIHQLPVNQEFTLRAGRELWGYPKFMADIAIDETDDGMSCAVIEDGTPVLALSIARGRTIPIPGQHPPTYTLLEGILRRTEWESSGSVAARIGGARLTLGEHPIAEELRALGLPKFAFMVQSVPQMRARFGQAEIIER